ALMGLLLGEQAARGEISHAMTAVVGQQAAAAIESVVYNAREPRAGVIATVVGVVTLFVGATGVFAELQQSLDLIWNVKPRPGRGVWFVIRSRFLSFGMVLGIAFLLLVSLVVNTVITALVERIHLLRDGLAFAAHAVNFAASLFVVT